MAPKARQPRKATDSASTDIAQPDISAMDEIDKLRYWNGKAMDEPLYYYGNKELLYEELRGSREFIKNGTVTGDRKISVRSVAHAQQIIQATIAAGTLDAPFNHTTIPAAPVEQDKPLTAAPIVGAAVVAAERIVPLFISDLGPLGERYQVRPDLCEAYDEQLLQHWSGYVTTTMVRNSMAAQFHNSGVEYIIAMEAKMAAPDSAKHAAASARATQIKAHRAAGLAGTTTEAWTFFLNKDRILNTALTGTPKFENESQRAYAYSEVLRSHSQDIFGRIESLKHRLETEKRLAGVGAAAIDHYVLLNQAVTQVFGDIESDQMRLAIEEGHAYLGRPDPKRNQPRDDKNKNKDKKKGNTPFKKPTKWSDGMRPCLNCKDAPVQGGKHLDSDCPSLKSDGAIGQGNLGRGDNASELLFDGATESTLPLNVLEGSADEIISALSAGRSLVGRGDTDGDSHDHSHDHDDEEHARRIYVMLDPDDDAGGIFYGDWSNEVAPMVKSYFKDIRSKTTRKRFNCVATVEKAILACNRANVSPTFHGPAILPGTQIGDILGDDEASDSESDDEPDDLPSEVEAEPAPTPKVAVKAKAETAPKVEVKPKAEATPKVEVKPKAEVVPEFETTTPDEPPENLVGCTVRVRTFAHGSNSGSFIHTGWVRMANDNAIMVTLHSTSTLPNGHTFDFAKSSRVPAGGDLTQVGQWQTATPGNQPPSEPTRPTVALGSPIHNDTSPPSLPATTQGSTLTAVGLFVAAQILTVLLIAISIKFYRDAGAWLAPLAMLAPLALTTSAAAYASEYTISWALSIVLRQANACLWPSRSLGPRALRRKTRLSHSRAAHSSYFLDAPT